MKITYTLSFPEPHTHYVQVGIHISGIEAEELLLKMAIWTPGSYLIREYQRNVDYVESITTGGKISRLDKTDKNTWRVDTRNEKEIIIRYNTYCFEYSVRTNFVDDSHALINGAPTFLFVHGYEGLPSEIHIEPYPSWKNISTALPAKEGNKWIRIANNTDELIDSPMEIGNHQSYFFEVGGMLHEVAVYGESNGSMHLLTEDLKKVIEVETSIFGSHPCSNYLFIIHHTENSFGGLEHLHSSVNFVTRWSYDSKRYQQVISLLAHEYFHLWNVKRIRPSSLGPFDYSTENYTTLLWFFEGITSYYDDYICYRAGITPKEEYLNIVTKNINDVVNTAGIDKQTLSEASFDTWLKYYRKNENTNNTQVSYYTKGAVIGLLLDFILLDATNGERSLDDILKKLYEAFNSDPAKGITESSLITIFNETGGIDFAPYFRQFIYETGLPGLPEYFEKAGMQLKDTTDATHFYLGLSIEWREGKLFIVELDRNYGAYQGGLNVQDEIIAIDGYRVMKDFYKIYSGKKPGDTIEVLISRQGTIKKLKFALSPDNRKNYVIRFPQNISEHSAVILKNWLHELKTFT